MATIKGINRELQARSNALIGIFALLSKQHGEARVLLERATRDAKKRHELWPKIRWIRGLRRSRSTSSTRAPA